MARELPNIIWDMMNIWNHLNKAMSFCDVLGQEKLKKVIIDKCKKFYDIEL